MATSSPIGVSITYGVRFADDAGDPVVVTSDETRQPFDGPSAAASHALHLRLSGVRDAHVDGAHRNSPVTLI